MTNKKTSLIPLVTLTLRDIKRFLRIWTQSLIPPMLTSVLFILIFGLSLGSRISAIEGVSYINFILPGLLMMGVIMSAYMASSFSLFIEISRQHSRTISFTYRLLADHRWHYCRRHDTIIHGGSGHLDSQHFICFRNYFQYLDTAAFCHLSIYALCLCRDRHGFMGK